MKNILRACLASGLFLGVVAESNAGLVTFDDLPTPPPTNSTTGLFFANNSSALYNGVTWDSRVTVVGDEFRVNTNPPGPLFGIPHSGHFFITNDSQANNGILLTTDQVLQGAWFGRNEYRGFGAGADQVTINALSGSTVLASVVFDLPAPTVAGQPGLTAFVDTSIFATLNGITGYRIDRHETQSGGGSWVGDDFNFTPASVPEPSSIALLSLGLLALGQTYRTAKVARRSCGASQDSSCTTISVAS
jgi:PEP-CTERM motif